MLLENNSNNFIYGTHYSLIALSILTQRPIYSYSSFKNNCLNTNPFNYNNLLIKIILNNSHFTAILPLNLKKNYSEVPSNLNNGLKPKSSIKRKIDTIDIVTPEKPAKSFKKAFDPKSINIEQLDKYIIQLSSHLQGVVDSNIFSWRHEEYLRKSRGNSILDNCTGFQLFDHKQVLHINQELDIIKASKTSSNQIVNARNVLHNNYIANVLVPEILMLICCNEFNLTPDQVDDFFLIVI